MAFGIDTFRTRLDLLKAQELEYFEEWNGGTANLDGSMTGGDIEFAGRNFLGGSFLWAHAEDTNASSEPDGATYPLAATDPSPDQPQNLKLTVNVIAPIQAPQTPRQQQTGQRGVIYGQIDAQAICNRVIACLNSGELSLASTSLVNIWLAVDPAVAFTADYWAGWSNSINHQIYSQPGLVPGIPPSQIQPFRPCILCSYTQGADNLLHPDPHVTAALSDKSYPGYNTHCFAFWADAAVGADANTALTPNPDLNWKSFDPAAIPLLWRMKNGFTLSTDADAPAVQFAFDADAINTTATQNPKDYMLTANRWQPNATSILNVGFSNSDAITQDQVRCLQTTDLPDMDDLNFGRPGHFHVRGGRVTAIGRYIRAGGVSSMGYSEAEMLSYGNFSIFTTWESSRTVNGVVRNPRRIGYFNPDPDGNPATQDDSGTLDGTDAFNYCGGTLKQTPQTPVLFAIDFDPYDPDAGDPASAADKAAIESWILTYFKNIQTARDNYASQTGRYYLIGVYGNGRIMQALYNQGIVSHFWAPGSQRSGSRPPRWPWYHVNRWQYNDEQGLYKGGNICSMASKTTDAKGLDHYSGPDPDADWGDGGVWSLTDPVAVSLNLLEQQELNDLQSALQKNWGQLTDPAPLPPVTVP